jgi:signal transduction histidine kinase
MNGSWNGARDSLLESQEAERQRLAQELHDGPLQELHSLDFALVALARHLSDEKAKGQWTAIRSTLHSVSRRLRALCQDLRPPALGPFGLSAVLRSCAESFGQHNPEVQVDLDLVEDDQQLPTAVRLTLYRICQQALRNVGQHANAQRVKIRLQLEKNQVVMAIEDDGSGFVVPNAWLDWASEGRFGLFESMQRAAAINGQLQIDTAPGQGVRLLVTAPLPTTSAVTKG